MTNNRQLRRRSRTGPSKEGAGVPAATYTQNDINRLTKELDAAYERAVSAGKRMRHFERVARIALDDLSAERERNVTLRAMLAAAPLCSGDH